MADVQQPGAAGGEHAAGVGGHGVVQALQARACPTSRSGQSTSRRPSRSSGPLTTVTTATGSCRVDRLGDLAELGERLPGDRLDEHVEDAAAGQADGERVVVADAVALERRHAGLDDVLGLLVDRALDAAAGDAADRGAVGADEHRGARRRGAERQVADDRAHPDGLPRLPPADQVVEHLTHSIYPLLGA